jgi:hypothetical protein
VPSERKVIKKGKRLRVTWENPKNVPSYLTSSNYKTKENKKRGTLMPLTSLEMNCLCERFHNPLAVAMWQAFLK